MRVLWRGGGLLALALLLVVPADGPAAPGGKQRGQGKNKAQARQGGPGGQNAGAPGGGGGQAGGADQVQVQAIEAGIDRLLQRHREGRHHHHGNRELVALVRTMMRLAEGGNGRGFGRALAELIHFLDGRHHHHRHHHHHHHLFARAEQQGAGGDPTGQMVGTNKRRWQRDAQGQGDIVKRMGAGRGSNGRRGFAGGLGEVARLLGEHHHRHHHPWRHWLHQNDQAGGKNAVQQVGNQAGKKGRTANQKVWDRVLARQNGKDRGAGKSGTTRAGQKTTGPTRGKAGGKAGGTTVAGGNRTGGATRGTGKAGTARKGTGNQVAQRTSGRQQHGRHSVLSSLLGHHHHHHHHHHAMLAKVFSRGGQQGRLGGQRGSAGAGRSGGGGARMIPVSHVRTTVSAVRSGGARGGGARRR